MGPVRRCSRSTCGQVAVATLTYVYSERAVVVGPLATYAEPHCYDLCAGHANGQTAPLGWEVVRHEPDPSLALARSNDDLEALAEAVREAARPRRPAGVETAGDAEPGTARRGHLRALPTS